MKTRLTCLILSCILIGSLSDPVVFGEMPTTAPTTLPTTRPRPARKPAEPADVAAPKLGKDGNIQERFKSMHESFLKRAKEGNIGLLFMGDSITEGWNRSAATKAIFEKAFGQYAPANFGISGDRTQHVLWRIENGELDGITPKVVVLMIGTNNIAYSAKNIAKADEKIVAEIRQKLPDSKVLVLGVFPRGADPKAPNVVEMRDKIKEVNTDLARLDDGKQIRFLDVGDKFLAPGGVLGKDIMPDALHPNEKGYQIWADAMQPLLDEMMK